MANTRVFLLTAAVAGIACVLVLFRLPMPLRYDFVMNLVVTFTGVVVGIPVGLGIARYQQSMHETRSKELEDAGQALRRMKLLELLQRELKDNRDQLEDLCSSQEESPRAYCAPGLKDNLWNALSDRGDLQVIDDLDLLEAISDAYHYIRWLKPIEQYYFHPSFNAATVAKDGTESIMGKDALDVMHYARPKALEWTRDALNAIEETLNKG